MSQYLYLTAMGFDVTRKRIGLTFQTEYTMYRFQIKKKIRSFEKIEIEN